MWATADVRFGSKADIDCRQDDFQNCCGSETPPSNFYARLPCPTHSQVWFAQSDEVGGVSNEIADEMRIEHTRGVLGEQAGYTLTKTYAVVTRWFLVNSG
jgi:hypothetical protein